MASPRMSLVRVPKNARGTPIATHVTEKPTPTLPPTP